MFTQPIVIGAFKSEEDIFRYIKGIDLLLLMWLKGNRWEWQKIVTVERVRRVQFVESLKISKKRVNPKASTLSCLIIL